MGEDGYDFLLSRRSDNAMMAPPRDAAYHEVMRLKAGAVVLLIIVVACSPSPAKTACTPGESIGCVGSGGCNGSQVCLSDGSGYGTCACGVDAGLDAATDGAADTSSDTSPCAGSQQLCGSTCTDVTTDSKNCGQCARDCLGAQCVAGECQPIQLAPSEAQPCAITTDANNVFWLNEGTYAATYTDASVKRLQRGKTTPQLLAPGTAKTIRADWPSSGLVLDAANVYFYNGGTYNAIYGVPKDGSTQPAPVISNINVSTLSGAITLEGTSLYWIDYDPNANPTVYWHMNTGSTSGGSFTTINSTQSGCFWSTSGSTSLYLTCTNAQNVIKMSLDGQTVTPIATTQAYPNSLVTDGTSVFWTNSGTSNGTPGTYAGTVSTVSVNGGKVTDLVKKIDIPYGVAVNDTYVYFVHDNGHTLSRVPKSGGAAIDLVTKTPVTCIAADNVGVYYCTGTSGQAGDVMMIAK